MKVVCEAKIFKEAIVIAERNTSKNKSLPILQSIYIETKGSILFIRATNLENALEISLPAKIDQNGSIAVSGKILNSFLSNIHDDYITLQNKIIFLLRHHKQKQYYADTHKKIFLYFHLLIRYFHLLYLPKISAYIYDAF